MYDVVSCAGIVEHLSRDEILNLGNAGIILYFYPKDNTPGCTIEASDFSAMVENFSALGYAVVGVSKDSTDSHCRFFVKQGLRIFLISDTSLALHGKFSTLGDKKMFGKTYQGTIRSTFVLSSSGDILSEWRNVRAKGHAQSVYDFLLS